MNNKSWRTTTCGVLIIAGCLIHATVLVLQKQMPNPMEIWACVLSGIGLIHASDHVIATGGTQ